MICMSRSRSRSRSMNTCMHAWMYLCMFLCMTFNNLVHACVDSLKQRVHAHAFWNNVSFWNNVFMLTLFETTCACSRFLKQRVHAHAFWNNVCMLTLFETTCSCSRLYITCMYQKEHTILYQLCVLIYYWIIKKAVATQLGPYISVHIQVPITSPWLSDILRSRSRSRLFISSKPNQPKSICRPDP